jgi:hypothetical protein
LLELKRDSINIIIFYTGTDSETRLWILEAHAREMTGAGWLYFGANVYDLSFLEEPSACRSADYRSAEALAAVQGMVFLNPAPPSRMWLFLDLVGKAMTRSNTDRAHAGEPVLEPSVWYIHFHAH